MAFATSNNTSTGGVAARFGPAPAAQAQAQARSNPVAALSSAFKRARPLDPAFVAATATINTTNAIHQSAASSVESLLDETVIAHVVAGSGMGMVDDDDMEVPVVHANKSRARALLRQIFPEKLLYSDPSKDPRIFAL